MTPGELIRELRDRKGLTQRRLALRAGTSQSAIARIERGDEDVTWGRLGSILTAMGEKPELASHPLPGRYRPERLNGGLRFNEFAGQLEAAGRSAKARDGDG